MNHRHFRIERSTRVALVVALLVPLALQAGRQASAQSSVAGVASAVSAPGERAPVAGPPVTGAPLGASVAGAPVGASELDLATALALAGRAGPTLAQVDAQFGMARGELRSAGQWLNPSFEYVLESPGAPIQKDEFFTLVLPLDVSGRRTLRSRATHRGTARLDASRVAARRSAELEVASAWVAAVLARAVASALDAQWRTAEEIAGLEAERAREGVSAEAAALRTRVEADRLAHQAAQAEGGARRALVALAARLGVAPDSVPALPAVLDEAAVRATAAADAGGLPSGDAAALLLRAQSGREELRAASLAREEAALRQRVERAGVIGDWQVQGGTKHTAGILTAQVGFALPLPVFNRNDGARERAVNAVREADASWRLAQLTVNGEVLAAAEQVQRLQALADRLARTAAAGDTIAASARVAYTEGHMTLLELLDAQRTASDARVTAQQFRADLVLARLQLARAVGAPLSAEVIR
jgi:cobalt-zinc-cadmium efflux system outer membrane protein